MKKISIICLIIIRTTCFAQIIDVNRYIIDENEDFFNHKFIQKNGVKSIEAEIFYKKELKPMETSKLIQQYTFAFDGNLKKLIATNRVKGNIIDTTLILFNYKDDKLVKKTQLDNRGYFSHSFEFNDQNLIVKDIYSREENVGGNRFDFIQGKSFEIFYETFSYETNNGKISKKRVSNSDGKPYNDIYYEYDDYGNLIKETSTLIVTKKSRYKTYLYNEFHQIIEKKEESNFFGKSITFYNYSYDEVGNLLSEKITKNGIPKTSIEFVYDGNMLLKAILMKDEGSSTIKITKFNTIF